MSIKTLTEKWVSGTGQKLMVHSKVMCIGGGCPIHRPSNHHMVKWKLNWRQDRRMMERICSHGIGHPDPDDAQFKHRMYGENDTVHGCDGCCKVKREKEDEDKSEDGALTWNELAEEYDKVGGGRRARTLPMEQIYDWATKQPQFEVGKEGTIRKKKLT